MIFKYANSVNSVVSRVTAEGVESYLVTAPIVVAWLAQGNTPEPFETPTEKLDRLKRERAAEINAAAGAEIISGVVSSALGTPYTYDTELEDQLNLLGTERKASVTGQSQYYRCADENGVKEFHLHTPVQLQQVLDDGAAHKLAILQKAATLKIQAAAATTEAEISQIVW